MINGSTRGCYIEIHARKAFSLLMWQVERSRARRNCKLRLIYIYYEIIFSFLY